MKGIDTLLDELIQREGGYTNHPADRGGPTNWGITYAVARAHGYNGDMRDLPKSTAKQIYHDIYWTTPKFNLVAARYPRLAEELFDTGVNMGPKKAASFLQRALSLLNRGVLDYPDLKPDGDLGKMSFYALDAYKAKRGPQGEVVLLRMVDAFQAVRYAEIAEANPTQEAFIYGWLANRVGV